MSFQQIPSGCALLFLVPVYLVVWIAEGIRNAFRGSPSPRQEPSGHICLACGWAERPGRGSWCQFHGRRFIQAITPAQYEQVQDLPPENRFAALGLQRQVPGQGSSPA